MFPRKQGHSWFFWRTQGYSGVLLLGAGGDPVQRATGGGRARRRPFQNYEKLWSVVFREDDRSADALAAIALDE